MELDSASEDSNSEKKRKIKPKPSRPTLNKAQSNENGRSGGSCFLTAAEQRAKDRKTEKKTADDPFEFLRDVRDVREENYNDYASC